MSKTIAVAGKGGTGKTTVAALVVRELRKRGKTPILAIDADPVSNLGPALGITPQKTIGQVGKEFIDSKLNLPPGMSKTSYLELQMNEANRQRMIGEMSNAIINSLPSGRRKGYLLRPRVFFTYQTLMEAILEADGITKEILDAQQEKIRLIQEMARAVDDPIRLTSMIQENEAKVDQEFFVLLTASMDAATKGGRPEFAQRLTTLLEKLIPELIRRGLRVGTIKHDLHGFEMDRPGKDSWRHKQAGASVSIISSPFQIGMVMDVDHDHHLNELSPFLSGVDIVLTEGYKGQDKAKMEVFRPEVYSEPLCKDDEHLVAFISNTPLDLGVPRFSPNDLKGLADFLISYCSLVPAVSAQQ